MNKSDNITILSFLFILFIFGKNIIAQDCLKPEAYEVLNGNNIRASIPMNGSLFRARKIENNINFSFYQFESATYSSTYPYPSTIFTTGIWVAAKNTSGELKLAASHYDYNIKRDFSAGPIHNNNGQISVQCDDYDRTWEVNGYEINQHISDFADNGFIDYPYQNIYAYPAHQNPHFEAIHGFALPNTPQGLAPFSDQNNDGIYNPDDGDYPLPEGVATNNIPRHLIWGIFNDAGSNHTQSSGEKLNIEVQLTVYSFYCDENELLSNSIFTSHKIINRGNETLDSLIFSKFVDFNLGCFRDDYIGCIPDMNTFYAYNNDEVDGIDSSGLCFDYFNNEYPTFGDNPPVQSITFLNQEMSSFIVGGGMGPLADPPYQMTAPTHYPLYYNYMNGLWNNGDSMTYGGYGLGGNQPTSFLFPDNPNDPNGWSMNSLNLGYGDRPTYANCFLTNQFNPNDFVKIDMAYTFYQDASLNHVETVDMVYDNTPILQQLYDNQFENCEIIDCSNDCVWTGDADKDSIVTTFDILQIGLSIGETGTIRNHPLIWQPFESQNWNSSFSNTDLKHTDCNGNGQIDTIDFYEAVVNFGKSYKITPPVDIYNYGPELSIHTQNGDDTLYTNSWQAVRVKINQEEEIAGLAFTLECDTSILNFYDPGYISLPWNMNQVSVNDIYTYRSVDTKKGEFHCSYVKIDGENSLTQNDYVSNLLVRAKDTSYHLIQTYLRLKNIRAMLADGTILDFGSQDFLLNVVNPNGDGIILENENLKNNSVQIFPNPTTDILNIKMEYPSLRNFSIFDIYGKKVLEKMEVNQSEIQLSTSHFSQGIYFFKVEMEGKELVQKFIKL